MMKCVVYSVHSEARLGGSAGSIFLL